MDSKRIEILLGKYLSGDTDLQEEAALREYFTNEEDIPAHLEEYRLLFGFFEREKQHTYERELPVPENARSFKGWGIAAGIAALLVLAWLVLPISQPTTTAQGDAQLASENTKALFNMMGDAVEESKENLQYFQKLKTLNITKNQFTSKNNMP